MSKLDDVKAKLEELGIEFDPEAKLADLKKLLPGAEPESGDEETESEKGEDIGGGITVRDPLILRPKKLPLVILLPEDASKAQRKLAQVLNGYAYKNPEKWNQKKEDLKDETGRVIRKGLLTILKDLKNAPDPVEPKGGLTYKNHLLEE